MNPNLKSDPRPVPHGDRQAGCRVRLSVVDVAGREIALLVDAQQNPGTYEVPFSTRNLGSGIYFSRLTAGAIHRTQKIIVTR